MFDNDENNARENINDFILTTISSSLATQLVSRHTVFLLLLSLLPLDGFVATKLHLLLFPC